VDFRYVELTKAPELSALNRHHTKLTYYQNFGEASPSVHAGGGEFRRRAVKEEAEAKDGAGTTGSHKRLRRRLVARSYWGDLTAWGCQGLGGRIRNPPRGWQLRPVKLHGQGRVTAGRWLARGPAADRGSAPPSGNHPIEIVEN
jgi:hypothetical protein